MQAVAQSFQTDDYERTVEMFFEKGWTDGLPITLPTRPLVEAMIAAGGRDRNEVLGLMPPKGGPISIEILAVNAVMGGCKPEHFPVVIAAIEAALQPQHNLVGVNQTTHMCVSLAIVGGPITQELGFNSRTGVFGNGFRANGAVGRAVRLAMWNLGGAVPGETDMATLSHPGEYTYCIAEESERNPWPLLHEEHGCAPGSDGVSMFACEGPHSMLCQGTPHEMLYILADGMSTLGNNSVGHGGEMLVVLNPRQANEFADAGWSKDDIRNYLWENAGRTSEEVRACGEFAETFRNAQVQARRILPRHSTRGIRQRLPISNSPRDIHIVVAGGDTYFAAIVPGWGSFGGYLATQPIRRP